MKKHNELVRFKNSFLPPQQQEILTNIISQTPTTVLQRQIQNVVTIYKQLCIENQYNYTLAYRVLTLCLINKGQYSIHLTEEIQRFFKNCLSSQSQPQLSLCSDLLILKQTQDILQQQHLRLLKTNFLKALHHFYLKNHKKQQSKKCSYTLREYCKASLQREKIKRNQDIYIQILRCLVSEVKLRVSLLVSRHSHIKAIQELSLLIGILEKSEFVVRGQCQQFLMQAYWALAVLHDQMHYLAYTKKYCSIALNIATRINNSLAISHLNALLQSLE